MRILVVHNHYQLAGGEDAVFANEVRLLRQAGHDVAELAVSNDAINGLPARLAAGLLVGWNPAGRRRVAAAIAAHRPDVLHVHNFFPLLSPALFDACASAGVPAVWTLHNFRVACANGLLFRDGQPCEACLGKPPWPAIRHGCYRDSRVGSAAVALGIAGHRMLGTWHRKVARFVALTDFARDKFIAAGLPAERIVMKPNFIADPLTGGIAPGAARHGAVFVGRLSREKGAHLLIEAWRGIDAPLTLIGEGPEEQALRAMAPRHVRFAGLLDKPAVLAAMTGAQLLVVPSLWYENFPMTVVEAMASATPVLASRLGALPTIIAEGETGALFAPGDADDLARVARGLLGDPALLGRLGKGARRHYQTHLSPQANLAALEAIYREAITQGPA